MDRYSIIAGDTPIEEIESQEAYRKRIQERLEARIEAADKAQDNLTQAFKELRRRGFYARQRFCCCRGCASAQLSREVEQKVKDGKLRKNFNGAVFYTGQEGFFRNRRDCTHICKLYLAYGPVETDNKVLGMPREEAGTVIAQVLREHGLTVEWDGDEGKSLLIDPIPGLWSEEGQFSCYGGA